MAFANHRKLYSLWNHARELDNNRRKAIAEQDGLHELLTAVEKRDEDAEKKATQEEKIRWEEEQCNTELGGKVEGLETELAKKV